MIGLVSAALFGIYVNYIAVTPESHPWPVDFRPPIDSVCALADGDYWREHYQPSLEEVTARFSPLAAVTLAVKAVECVECHAPIRLMHTCCDLAAKHTYHEEFSCDSFSCVTCHQPPHPFLEDCCCTCHCSWQDGWQVVKPLDDECQECHEFPLVHAPAQ